MSTEEPGGGGVVQGFASCQLGPPLKPLPPRMSRAGDDQGGLEPPPSAPAVAGFGSQAAGGSSPAETPLVSSGDAEQEVQQRPTRNLASRYCNFTFDDKKVWICGAGVLLVLPFLLGIIYRFFSR